jgi:hypothetical protein
MDTVPIEEHVPAMKDLHLQRVQLTSVLSNSMLEPPINKNLGHPTGILFFGIGWFGGNFGE